MDTHSASHETRWIPTTPEGLATAATAKRDHVKQDRTKEDAISTDGVLYGDLYRWSTLRARRYLAYDTDEPRMGLFS
jgi:hypothetical protein